MSGPVMPCRLAALVQRHTAMHDRAPISFVVLRMNGRTTEPDMLRHPENRAYYAPAG
jgi:hypothetical protein